jgi:predicted alpha/beta-fold hydrolase
MNAAESEAVAPFMTSAGAPFAPSWLLRNRHLQSILPSLRVVRGGAVARRAADLLTHARDETVDCGAGVRLLGQRSTQVTAGRPAARELVVLLHGWEGSAESLYVLSLAALLFEQGCDVFRLNFRDHGPSHHLNRDLFHSCRIDEVVGAVTQLAAKSPAQRLTVAGFSLGGNFALRVAVRAPQAGIRLARAVAVCPVLDPAHTLDALESGPFIYRNYFVHKWKRSLRLKQSCFPEHYDFREILAMRSLRAMTDHLVLRHSEYPSLEAYLRGYSIVDDALATLAIPSHIVTALDDPIIPATDIVRLARPPALEVTTTALGGHCGFFERTRGASWIDLTAARLILAAP